MKKKTCFWMMIFVCCLFNIHPCFASSLPQSNSENITHWVFVLDSSGSMLQTDPHSLSKEIIQNMIDMGSLHDMSVGFVAYNDTILSSQPVAPLADATYRDSLKAAIQNTPKIRDTDIGLGLAQGLKLLAEERKPGAKQAIILLSDGAIDVQRSPLGRTNADSQADVDRVSQECSDAGVPIYTIGLSTHFDGNMDTLRNISAATNGRFFTAASPMQLTDILNELFTEYTGSIVRVSSETAVDAGKQQQIIELPGSPYGRTTVSLFSMQSLRNLTVDGPECVKIGKTQTFAVYAFAPSDGANALISYDAIAGQNVQISVMTELPLSPVVYTSTHVQATHLDSVIRYESTAPLLFSFASPDNDQYTAFYASLQGELAIQGDHDGSSLRIPGVPNANGLSFSLPDLKDDRYVFRFHVTGPWIDQSWSWVAESSIADAIPVSANAMRDEIVLCVPFERKRIPLRDLYPELTGEIQIAVNKDVNTQEDIELQSEWISPNLYLSAKQNGTETLHIWGTDNVTGRSTELFLTVRALTIWQRYPVYVTLAVVLLILLVIFILAFFLARKRTIKKPIEPVSPVSLLIPTTFTGSLAAYFIRLRSYDEVLPQRWSLAAHANRRRLSLRELLVTVDLQDTLPESRDIWFSPGKDRTLIVQHHTNCTVLVGGDVLPRGEKATIKYGQKLHVSFEDGESEVELHYKKSVPSEERI